MADFMNPRLNPGAERYVTLPEFTTAINDTGWIQASLLNGWQHYPGWPLMYRRKDGIVYVRGLVFTGGASNAYVTQLPVGFRPGYPSMSLQNVTDTGSYRLDIGADGAIFFPNGAGAGAGNFVSVHPPPFPAGG